MLTTSLVVLLVAAQGSLAADWSRFRGPNGSGVAETAAFPVEFGPERNVVWKVALPPGHSSPVLDNDRIYVTALEGEALLTIAVDRATGRILWRREAPRARALRLDKRNHPASPSPAADGENVYVFFQDFGLLSYDREGRERWRVPLGPFDNAYGMGASPIVAEGVVVQVCDQSNGSFMLAVGKNDGRQLWKVDRPESKSGHSTPIVYRPVAGPPQLLVPGSFFLSAYAVATGEKLWWVRGLAFEMKATPVIHDSTVFIHGTSTSSFEDSYGGKLPSFEELRAANDKNADGRFSRDEVPDDLAKRWFKLMDLDGDGFLSPNEWAYYQAARSSKGGMWAFKLGGKGDVTDTAVRWHYDRSVPQLPSPLLYEGVLYMLNDGGIMTALDPATGRMLAQSRLQGAVDSFYSSPIAADGKILVISESGKAVVLKADGTLTILAVNDLDDAVHATPALEAGRLYVRTRSALYCFGLPSPTPGLTRGPPPDTILHNGKIVTVDDTFTIAEAVAVTGGAFTAVGTSDVVRKLAGPKTRLIDLRGRTVVPGLADNHLHGAGGGPGVDLSMARSLGDVLGAIAARAKQGQPGELILTNSDWHEAQLREQRLPLRRDLDGVAPDNPVVVVRGGHEYILNSAALKKWSITETTPEPAGGRISRYDEGTLNGELVDRAKSLVTLPSPPRRSREELIQERIAEYAKLHAAGLTTVRHPGGSPEQFRLLQEMQRRGLLTMHVVFLLRPDAAVAADGLAAALGGIAPDEGDAWLRIGGVKLAVDGGFEGAFMRDPYAEPWGGGGKFRGLQTVPADRYTAMVTQLNRLGWRVFTHAVGDAAIDQVLTAYEAANAETPIAGRRWGIEHGFIPRPDHFPRMRALGIGISAQNHLYLAGPSLVSYWGRERAHWTTPVRAYLEQGLPVSSGTDSPVVPYPPLWSIYHFVTRDTISGGVMGADQRITREQALRLATVGNAWLTFEEKAKGTIEPGRLADLVVLSDDILTCPEKRIEQTTVLMTMAGGKVVFERGDSRR